MDQFIISKSKNKLVGKTHQLVLTPVWSLFTTEADSYVTYHKGNTKAIIFGDYIGTKEEFLASEHQDIPKLKGNFYAIVIQDENVKIYNSFLSILPIYYNTDFTFISSSIQCIKKQSPEDFVIDKKFILENLLFNYGFFNRTLYRGIQLTPSNCFLELTNDKVAVRKHFDTTSLFTQKPKKGKKVANQISDLFIETAKQYFPESSFDIAFTSGFDGRTLVSCATETAKKFDTFSFGKPENDDVAIPQKNATALGIPYQYFDLGQDSYTKKKYIENAKEYTEQSPGTNGLIYSHFLHSTKEIAKKSKYLISGVVGSELFRALHLTGAVTSQALVDIFASESDEEIRHKIANAKPLLAIRKQDFAAELEELIEELITYKKSIPNHLTANQQFYLFVFDEIFRKFFGQWIYIQMRYIQVRTPFLDYTFIKELLNTQYAGANNDFFTENPFKRMKGQYIYADIIRKTNTKIYHQKTGKGYRPKDVRESLYLLNIILPFIKKRLKRKVKQVNLDNLGIISGALQQKETFKKMIQDTSWTNKEYLIHTLDKLSPYTNEKERDTLLMSISILLAMENILLTNSKKTMT